MKIDWNHHILIALQGGRGGYEFFLIMAIIFTMTQWYPRLCVYDFRVGKIHTVRHGEFDDIKILHANDSAPIM
jgi:hypothetical protein